jgi:hypothetical protein
MLELHFKYCSGEALVRETTDAVRLILSLRPNTDDGQKLLLNFKLDGNEIATSCLQSDSMVKLEQREHSAECLTRERNIKEMQKDAHDLQYVLDNTEVGPLLDLKNITAEDAAVIRDHLNGILSNVKADLEKANICAGNMRMATETMLRVSPAVMIGYTLEDLITKIDESKETNIMREEARKKLQILCEEFCVQYNEVEYSDMEMQEESSTDAMEAGAPEPGTADEDTLNEIRNLKSLVAGLDKFFIDKSEAFDKRIETINTVFKSSRVPTELENHTEILFKNGTDAAKVIEKGKGYAAITGQGNRVTFGVWMNIYYEKVAKEWKAKLESQIEFLETRSKKVTDGALMDEMEW